MADFDLSDEQRAEMALRIYRGLDISDAQSSAAYLEERMRRSTDLNQLVRTPVMLWTAAVVHTLRGKLPETRAALYSAYVDILLRHSHKQQEGDVDELADALLSVLSDRDLAHELGRYAQQRIWEVYYWDARVGEVERAYRIALIQSRGDA